MALINKKNFSIIRDNINYNDKVWFKCDDIIAPVVQLLNLKGYITIGACYGHPYLDTIDRKIINTYCEKDKLPINMIGILRKMGIK